MLGVCFLGGNAETLMSGTAMLKLNQATESPITLRLLMWAYVVCYYVKQVSRIRTNALKVGHPGLDKRAGKHDCPAEIQTNGHPKPSIKIEQ